MWKGPHCDCKRQLHFSDPSSSCRDPYWAWMRPTLHEVHPWVPWLWRAATSLWSPSRSCVGCSFLTGWHKGIWIVHLSKGWGSWKSHLNSPSVLHLSLCHSAFPHPEVQLLLLPRRPGYALGASNAMKIVRHKISVSCVCHGSKGKTSNVLWGTADT